MVVILLALALGEAYPLWQGKGTTLSPKRLGAEVLYAKASKCTLKVPDTWSEHDSLGKFTLLECPSETTYSWKIPTVTIESTWARTAMDNDRETWIGDCRYYRPSSVGVPADSLKEVPFFLDGFEKWHYHECRPRGVGDTEP